MEEREDHELTLLAGKAAGLRLQWSDNCGDWSTGEPYGKDDKRWRPLHNNDDALRLAVGLNIHILRFDGMTTARPLGADHGFDERDNGEPMLATRLAIVRAAASMSKLGLSAGENRQIEYLMDIYR